MIYSRYIPQEEVPLYQSKGKQLASSVPKYPVGFTEEEYKAAQAKREKELKKQLSKQSQEFSKIGVVVVGTAKKKKKKKQDEIKHKEDASTCATLISNQTSNNESFFNSNHLRNQDPSLKSKSENSCSSQSNNSKTKKREEKSANGTSIDPVKRIKNLKKRLREMEEIESKVKSGVKLEKEQLEKLSRREEVLKEMSSLMENLDIN